MTRSADLKLVRVSMMNAIHDLAVLVARLDNLGKGASGAAVQNIGLMLGLRTGVGARELADA